MTQEARTFFFFFSPRKLGLFKNTQIISREIVFASSNITGFRNEQGESAKEGKIFWKLWVVLLAIQPTETLWLPRYSSIILTILANTLTLVTKQDQAWINILN